MVGYSHLTNTTCCVGLVIGYSHSAKPINNIDKPLVMKRLLDENLLIKLLAIPLVSPKTTDKWLVMSKHPTGTGVPDRNRTCNPQLRRLVLYPVELRAQFFSWAISMLTKTWSGWRDSNSRHPAPKAGALPGYATPRRLRIIQTQC